ncbi:MAG: hypothetical protein LBV38_05550 [Alistipes sp.]|jgi:hypothetical protein|nr:hypothetical protein [Alistipes sp.]
MVEVKRYIVLAAALMCVVVAASGQQRVHVAGLEDHAEYRALVDEERALVRRADSIAGRIAELRQTLRTDTLGRAATSAAIVAMEGEGFDIRGRRAQLAGRINTIEQEWILENLLASEAGASGGAVGADSTAVAGERHSRNLVYSSYFERGLDAEQLAELREAQEAEMEMPVLLASWRDNRRRRELLAEEYDRTGAQIAADSVKGMFDVEARAQARIEERIGGEWSAIFDSKSYLYNLIADRESRTAMLTRFEEGMERLRGEQSRWQGVAPASLTDYVLQKRMLVEYETALAENLGNAGAVDSLRWAARELPDARELEEFGPVELRERLFLDYSDITIGTTPYNSSNPIPEVAVWPRGSIWRVRLGGFASRQSPSLFRGASPLGVMQGADGRFTYFAGGFASDSLAREAVERMRRVGFRSPSAVAWIDGVYIDPAADEGARLYRVEISGVGELPVEVREAIASAGTGDSDIVRSGEAYVVTPLDAAAATTLRTALERLRTLHPEMNAKLFRIESGKLKIEN